MKGSDFRCPITGRPIKHTPTTSLKPRGVIVGEPTELIGVGHKGVPRPRQASEDTRLHSSQIDRGVSAVMVAARLMVKLEELGAELRAAKRDAGLLDY